MVGVEKLEEPTEATDGRARTRQIGESKRVCAKRLAEHAAQLFLDEDGECRITGVVLGGRVPVRRFAEKELPPTLKSMLTNNQRTKNTGKEGVLELIKAQFGKVSKTNHH